jgi:hypothetical protein
MTNPNHTPALTVRLKPEIRTRIQADADREYRSLTKQLEMIIDAYYAAEDSKNLKAADAGRAKL